MELCRLVDIGAFVLNCEVLGQSSQELSSSLAVEVLNHAVVVKDGQLAGGEAYGHKIIVLLLAGGVGILACLLCTNQGSGS